MSKGVYERKKITKKKGKKAKTAYDGIKDFPDDMLTVLDGILTCRACNSEVSLKSLVIKLHINGETHKRNVVNRDKSQLTLLDYRKMVVVNERMENATGATIALDVSAYRMSVCHALLKSATPDTGSEIRNLLEDGQTKCPKQACSDMIPLLQKKEYDETRIALEFKKKNNNKLCVLFHHILFLQQRDHITAGLFRTFCLTILKKVTDF